MKKKQGPVLTLLDHFLTATMFVMTAWLLRAFAQLGELPQVGACALVCVLGRPLCRAVFRSLGKRIGTKSALANKLNLEKFVDQSWEFATHLTFSICEIYIFSQVDWLTEQWKMYLEHPEPMEPMVKGVYLLEIVVYTSLAFTHRFFLPRRKDYFVMFSHHIITSYLLTVSYTGRWERVGLAIVACHDISDVFVDLLKMSNYMGLDSKSGLYITEIVFVLHLACWLVTRMYYFPVYLIYSTFFNTGSTCAPETDNAFTWNFNWICWIGRVGLVTLFCMHCYWYGLFVKILKDLVSGVNAHETGREHYEGDSEDEKED